MIVKILFKAGFKNKQTDDIYTTQITQKKTLRHKGTSRAPSLYTYRDKNKDRNHIINSREMLQTSDKSAKSPNFKSDFDY